MDADSATRDTLTKVKQYNSPAGYMAGGLSALWGTGEVTWPIPLLDTTVKVDTSGERTTTNGDGMMNGVAGANPISNGTNTNYPRFALYPNPTFGNFTIQASGSGMFTVYTMIGQEVKKYVVPAGQTNMQLPASLATGVYMGYFKPDDGSKTQEVKLVYQP